MKGLFQEDEGGSFCLKQEKFIFHNAAGDNEVFHWKYSPQVSIAQNGPARITIKSFTGSTLPPIYHVSRRFVSKTWHE